MKTMMKKKKKKKKEIYVGFYVNMLKIMTTNDEDDDVVAVVVDDDGGGTKLKIEFQLNYAQITGDGQTDRNGKVEMLVVVVVVAARSLAFCLLVAVGAILPFF